VIIAELECTHVVKFMSIAVDVQVFPMCIADAVELTSVGL
jgi:hypothetical protein